MRNFMVCTAHKILSHW